MMVKTGTSCERSHGAFRRAVPPSFSPDDDKVKASYANGVLSLRVKKSEGMANKDRKIAIKAG